MRVTRFLTIVFGAAAAGGLARADVCVGSVTANGSPVSSGSTVLLSHDALSGPNRVLVVAVTYGEFQPGLAVTLNDGGPLPMLDRVNSVHGSTSIWWTSSPPSGLTTVTVSNSVNGDYWIVGAVTFLGSSGVGSPVDAASDGGVDALVTVPVAQGGLVFDSVEYYNGASGPPISATSGSALWNIAAPNLGERTGGASVAPASGSTVSLSWTTSFSGVVWSIIGVEIIQAGSGVTCGDGGSIDSGVLLDSGNSDAATAPDGAVQQDAGLLSDAAVPPDAGLVSDAAVPPDASNPPDAATELDAAVSPDGAAMPDAGMAPDGGADGAGGEDGGPRPEDAGTDAGLESALGWPCGCASASNPAAVAFLAVSLFALRRRRRRSRAA